MNRIYILYMLTAVVFLLGGINSNVSAQHNDHTHDLKQHRGNLPDSVKHILEQFEIQHEGADVGVEIEKENGRTEIRIVVEHHDHKHDGEHEDHGHDWERELKVKAEEIEKALHETHAKLEEAERMYLPAHPAVRKLRVRAEKLERAMHEIEEKWESMEKRHDEQGHTETEELEAYHHRIREIEEAMTRKANFLEQFASLFGKEQPQFRAAAKELEQLKKAHAETIEGLERAERAHHHEHGTDEDHDEADEFIDEVFGCIEGVEKRIDGLERKLERIIRMLRERD